jgi:hypothetical protein
VEYEAEQGNDEEAVEDHDEAAETALQGLSTGFTGQGQSLPCYHEQGT